MIQSFHKEKYRKEKVGGWREEGFDKMERLVKEIRVDQGEDRTVNGRVVRATGALRGR
jgi:hypothetical protein